MRKYTVADIMALDSCYEIQRVEQLWSGREALSLTEICRLDIKLADIIWVASRILPERAIRLFAADCAEHVLWLYERKYPADERPRRCIDTARRYATGNASQEELAAARIAASAAAGAAASNAARIAAGAAACGAGWAAADAAADDAADAATRDAVWAAAGDAVWAAARAAVCWAAAGDAEQKWQLGRLIEYVTEAEENPMKG